MSEQMNLNPVNIVEQNTVLDYIKAWLESIDFLDGISVSIASLDLTLGSLSIVPNSGVRKARQYACGGYQVYFPFSIYYRTAAAGDDEITAAFELMDNIGIAAMNAELNTLLGSDMTADSFSQETTTVLISRNGAVTDYKANFVLIYSV